MSPLLLTYSGGHGQPLLPTAYCDPIRSRLSYAPYDSSVQRGWSFATAAIEKSLIILVPHGRHAWMPIVHQLWADDARGVEPRDSCKTLAYVASVFALSENAGMGRRRVCDFAITAETVQLFERPVEREGDTLNYLKIVGSIPIPSELESRLG